MRGFHVQMLGGPSKERPFSGLLTLVAGLLFGAVVVGIVLVVGLLTLPFLLLRAAARGLRGRFGNSAAQSARPDSPRGSAPFMRDSSDSATDATPAEPATRGPAQTISMRKDPSGTWHSD